MMLKLTSSNAVFVYPDEMESNFKDIAEFISPCLVINPGPEDLCNDCFITPGYEIPSLDLLDGRLYVPKSMCNQLKIRYIML